MPFRNSHVLLLDKERKIDFDFTDFILRSDATTCGNLLIDFTIEAPECNEKYVTEMFDWNQHSFTIKSLPINGVYLVGKYRVRYKVYLQDF